jgi:rod shape determining protein RodA
LISALFIGKAVGGSQRWINIGSFNLQPSEFAKIFMIIFLADFFSKRKEKIDEISTLLISLTFVIIPLFLIFKQPDLGTSLTLLVIWAGMFFIAGGKLIHLGYVGVAGIISLPVFWHFLKDYQKKRLLIFLDPDVDPINAGYHLIQSKIAIGSSGIFGKGISFATQSKLNFIPSHHTDFIFSTLAEMFGFVGVIIILLLYTIFLLRGIKIISVSKDNFGKLISAGIVSMWIFHIFVNIGMTVGIMPITGIPLPFISYGGSSLIVNVIATSLILNVGMRSQTLKF